SSDPSCRQRRLVPGAAEPRLGEVDEALQEVVPSPRADVVALELRLQAGVAEVDEGPSRAVAREREGDGRAAPPAPAGVLLDAPDDAASWRRGLDAQPDRVGAGEAKLEPAARPRPSAYLGRPPSGQAARGGQGLEDPLVRGDAAQAAGVVAVDLGGAHERSSGRSATDSCTSSRVHATVGCCSIGEPWGL